MDFLLANILHCVTCDMAGYLYNREEVLDFVLADSGDENSDSDDELIVDVQDESGEAIILPVFETNRPAHEREPLLYLDEDLNEASVTVIFPILLSFLSNIFMYCDAKNIMLTV